MQIVLYFKAEFGLEVSGVVTQIFFCWDGDSKLVKFHDAATVLVKISAGGPDGFDAGYILVNSSLHMASRLGKVCLKICANNWIFISINYKHADSLQLLSWVSMQVSFLALLGTKKLRGITC